MVCVVKIGGGAGIVPDATLRDIATLVAHGQQIVVVHGCSAATDQLADRLAIPTRYITSGAGVRSRYTDARTIEVFIMAARRVNVALVTALQAVGVDALGLCGVDGGLLRGPRKDVVRDVTPDGRQRIIRDDHTGRVDRVNGRLLVTLLERGYLPVIAPLALADTGEVINVDGDRVAAQIAVTLNAATLVILTNVPGLLEDSTDRHSLITTLARDEITAYEGRVTGGMRRKLIGAREALAGGGVQRVIMADAADEHPLVAALQGKGTVIA